ncbi:hypothetical protein B9G98_03068 [Wickerhamiella sorbophila]|uniref:Uncharacterized protein n=1 Tax=Wickerhamiella sorbophila TaxID=45607 RepID=A0A2T0FKD7_9ASCO|nr:hypothetical protein B9G98_03068 [Wickerhamiella sorbophila]PRT55448.1 hypothetical protein B9G98_03068 [Wickerhamiella sorbophila]
MKIGVVGTGIFATDAHVPAFEQAGNIQVTAAYNRTKSKAEKFVEVASNGQAKVYDSIDEVFSDANIDAVDGLLPVDNNLELVKKAIAAGKPLAFEKPIAHDLDAAKKIVELTNKSDVPIMVLENWCFHERTLKMKELVKKIGKVELFLYQTTKPFFISKYHQTAWRQKPKHIGGFISDGGVHDMAFITEVLGDVAEVNARTSQLREQNGDIDTLNAQLRLESGAFGSFTYAKAFGAADSTLSFQIFGTEGSVVFDGNSIVLRTGPDGNDMSSETFELAPESVNGVVSEFKNFTEAVKTNDKSVIVSTPAKSFHHFATIVACTESSKKNGNTVQVSKA